MSSLDKLTEDVLEDSKAGFDVADKMDELLMRVRLDELQALDSEPMDGWDTKEKLGRRIRIIKRYLAGLPPPKPQEHFNAKP